MDTSAIWRVVRVLAVAVVLMCCMCVGVLALAIRISSVPPPTATATRTLKPTMTVRPMTPTRTPRPTMTMTPLDALQKAVFTRLGDGNRDARRISVFELADDGTLTVRVAGNDSLTDDMIRLGIQEDVFAVIDVVYHRGRAVDWQALVVEVTFRMADEFGNSEESVVVRAVYERETLGKVNWSAFKHSNVYTIADDLYLHPQMRP